MDKSLIKYLIKYCMLASSGSPRGLLIERFQEDKKK